MTDADDAKRSLALARKAIRETLCNLQRQHVLSVGEKAGPTRPATVGSSSTGVNRIDEVSLKMIRQQKEAALDAKDYEAVEDLRRREREVLMGRVDPG